MYGATAAERFAAAMEGVEPTAEGCLEWPKSVRGNGYGDMRGEDGKNHLAHRVAYEVAFGAIPDDLLVCHRCDNRRCVNAEHLFLGTISDNAIDMRRKQRHPCQRLNPELVLKARALHSQGLTGAEIARQMGMPGWVIREAVSGRSFAWVESTA
jgi:hypothetical protein